jgi:hypothetical protein
MKEGIFVWSTELFLLYTTVSVSAFRVSTWNLKFDLAQVYENRKVVNAVWFGKVRYMMLELRSKSCLRDGSRSQCNSCKWHYCHVRILFSSCTFLNCVRVWISSADRTIFSEQRLTLLSGLVLPPQQKYSEVVLELTLTPPFRGCTRSRSGWIVEVSMRFLCSLCGVLSVHTFATLLRKLHILARHGYSVLADAPDSKVKTYLLLLSYWKMDLMFTSREVIVF